MKLTIQANVPPGGFQPDGVSMGADTKLTVGRLGHGLRDLFRLFLTKFELCSEEFTEDDRLALQLLGNELLLNHESGNGTLDNTCVNIIKDLLKDNERVHSSLKTVRNRLVSKGLLFANKREYFGRIGQMTERTFSIHYKRRLSKKHHTKHIGVGYQDKGTSRMESFDGSPSWQEVASRKRAIPVVDIPDFTKQNERGEEWLLMFFYEGYTRTVKLSKYRFRKDNLELVFLTDNYLEPTEGAAEALHQNGYPQLLVEFQGRKFFLLTYSRSNGKRILLR